MADPLSVISFGIQVTQSLVEFYSAYKDQDNALAKIIVNLENLLGILQSIDGAVQNRQSQTDTLLQEIDKAAAGCREIIEELWDECQKFQKDSSLSLKGRIQVAGRRVTYPFRTSTLQKLEEDIAEIRENLSLALNVLQLRNQTGLEDGISELKIIVQQTNTIQISAMIRDWLKAPDATIDHNVACEKRHTSTGLWLINGQKFRTWLSEPNSLLWINGFAGCGKSVICSTAIEAVRHTFRDSQQSSIGIGFFYFSFNDETKTDCSGMLRALLLQLSAQLEGGEKDLQKLHGLYKSGAPPVKVLLDSLRQTICKFSSTYILLDALDESPRDDKREYVLDAIEKIRQWDLPTLHLLVTSRNEIDIRNSLETPSCQDIPMRNPETDMDIQNFISYQLSNDPKLQRWKSRHDEIQEKLINKAEGVFRYVECQLLALKRARIRNELDKCLRSLPRDLDETYERVLCSIDEGYVQEVRLILNLLCVSDQPVTMEQLIDALTIDVSASELQLDRDGRSFTEDDILDICLGLIEVAVVEGDSRATAIARIAHFSVQEYLESDRISQKGAAKFRIQEETTYTEMAQICLVYLLDPSLSIGNLNEKKLEMFPFACLAAMQWFLSYNNSGERKSEIESLILKLFKGQPESFETWVLLDEMNQRGSRVPNFNHPVPSPIYYTALLGLENILHALIASWPEDTTISAAFNAQGGEYANPLQAASLSGHEKVVQILLDHGADVNAQGGQHGNALVAASYNGYEKVVHILLDHGANINAQGGGTYDTALQAASFKGHENVVQVLLDHGADVNAKGSWSSNALGATLYEGYENIAQILLDHGADINAQGGEYGNALQAASNKGYEKLVQIFLDHGADVNAQGGLFGNALQAASNKGYEKLVQILLDHGADVNAQGGEYGNALQAASYSGHKKMIQILLDHGAEVNASGPSGSALQAASMEGHEDVVQILLDLGADVNAQGGYYGNALQAAASSDFALFDFRFPDREKMIQILLDHGADVNAQGGYYGNALQAAASFKHELYERAPSSHYESVIQILLDHGADVNAPGGYFGNPLQAAAYRASTKGVQILLDHGADVNAQGGDMAARSRPSFHSMPTRVEAHKCQIILLDHGAGVNAQGGKYGNALQAAACRGHAKIVQILLDHGADINAQGGKYDSAIEAAFWEDHEEVTQILLNNGADDKAIRSIESEEIGR
ncbi:NACHT nucleoside triphosphatase [Penicillium concentricum]|uniref:NACHT nucleoside triphosphatase n=1 Tax=Penicillium concentricum TaxID=293559 RepID=A0A9W9V9I1_9EURO|nr:NACHT nucleoside triphosphatase [Penicillium concentricum]KAJ5372564.1 NACHT nucleoside triphosphatase [Penicillium concentricum]